MLDIKKYESVAMFCLSDEERETLKNRAEAIAESFDALETVDTDGVAPLVTVLDMHNVLREDVSEKFLTKDEIMSNAPEKHDGYFQVPGTIV